MQAIIQSFLALLEQIAPEAVPAVIEKVIQILTVLIPVIVAEYKDLLPIVMNIITALKDSAEITDEQWDALDAMSAQYDTEFKAALAAAKAEDAAIIEAGAQPAT